MPPLVNQRGLSQIIQRISPRPDQNQMLIDLISRVLGKDGSKIFGRRTIQEPRPTTTASPIPEPQPTIIGTPLPPPKSTILADPIPEKIPALPQPDPSRPLEPKGGGILTSSVGEINFKDLPDSAKGGLQSDLRVKVTNEGLSPNVLDELENSKFVKATVGISELQQSNPEVFSSSFIKRNVETTEPIVINKEGIVVDGNNRLREAFERGDKTIEVFKAQPSEGGELKASMDPLQFLAKADEIVEKDKILEKKRRRSEQRRRKL